MLDKSNRNNIKQPNTNTEIIKKHPNIALIIIPLIIVCLALTILIISVIIPNIKINKEYNSAMELYNMGKFDEAIIKFEKIIEYKDSSDMIIKSENALKEIEYNKAISLVNSNKQSEAINILRTIDGYKDSSEIILSYYKNSLKTASIGDFVKFGAYEQNNDIVDTEELEWIVLDKVDNKILILSRYGLDCHQYNRVSTKTSWEKCTMREWLNEDFLNHAFIKTEINFIQNTTVNSDDNPEYTTEQGNSTIDKIFLLSIKEANKYFASNSDRLCEPTNYAFEQSVYKNENGYCKWWLRTLGEKESVASFVKTDGSFDYKGTILDYGRTAIRPAFWIDIGL